MSRVRAYVPVLLVARCGCADGARLQPGANRPSTPRRVSLPTPPAPADVTTPESAVSAYLDWTSYAYALGNSEVASNTMGANEEVRVNSYVQLNKEKQRRISQVLVSFKTRSASVEGTRATLVAAEVWKYRYLSADGAKAITDDVHGELRDDLPRGTGQAEHVGRRVRRSSATQPGSLDVVETRLIVTCAGERPYRELAQVETPPKHSLGYRGYKALETNGRTGLNLVSP